MKNALSPTRDYRADHKKHYFSGIAPEEIAEHGIEKNELIPYLPPSNDLLDQNRTEIHFLSYYKKWTPQRIFIMPLNTTITIGPPHV